MSESKLNIELFRAVREKIATVPVAYDQEQFGRPEESAPCGTAACIAGWTVVLADAMPVDLVRHAAIGDPINKEQGLFKTIPDKAMELLGLTSAEANVLFAPHPEGDYDYDEPGWPTPFCYQWEDSPKEERPRIAVAYLDHIIETGKVLE